MKSLCSSKETDELFGCQLLYISKQNNHLMERVKNDELDKRMNSNWDKIDASVDDTVPDFPKLNEDDLRNLTRGVYQLKLVKCYQNEHQNDNGQYNILINKQDNQLLMAKIQSRHVSKKEYKM